jgi:MFS family permease
LTAHNTHEPKLARRVNQKLPFFYGWVIVLIGFLCVFMTGATTFWAIPVFVDPMSADTGWSHTSIVVALSVRFIMSAFGGLFLGRLVDQSGGAARILLVGVLLDAALLLAIRWVSSPLQFIVLYGVAGGLAGTGVRIVMATLTAKWFVARRGTAVGFSANGGGFSAIIMSPITALLIEQFGWRDAWGILGIIMAVILVPLVPLAVRAPEDMGLQPDNGVVPRSAIRSAAAERSFALTEVVRTWQFWLLLIGVALGNYSLQLHTYVMVPHFEDIGFSSTTAASALSVYGFTSIGMRFFWGILGDRMSVRITIIVQSVLTAIGAFLLLQVGGVGSLYVIMAFQGMMLSGFPPLQLLVWPEFFGRMHIGSIVGVTQFVTSVLGASGPLLAALIYDQTGSYEASIVLLIVTWLACAGVMLVVKPAGARAGIPSQVSVRS